MKAAEHTSEAHRAAVTRASSISPSTPTTTQYAAPGPLPGRDGRLSGLVDHADADTFKALAAARSSLYGAPKAAGWVRTSSSRNTGAKSGQQSAPGSSRFLGSAAIQTHSSSSANMTTVNSTVANTPNVARSTTSPGARALSPTSGGGAPTSSTANLGHYKIALNHLSVEETIHLRNIFDRYSTVETNVGGGAGGGDGASSGGGIVEKTLSHALDIFTVTALLHHTKMFEAFPSDVELRRMMVRVSIANAQVVARPTNLDAIAAATMEPVVEFPTMISFQIYLQLAELCKRWALREDDEDEVLKAYAFYTKNRRYIKAVDDATIQAIMTAGKWPSNFQQQLAASGIGSVTPSGALFSISSNTISPAMLDLDGSSQQPQQRDGREGSNTFSHHASTGPHSHLNIHNLQDILKSVGAEYDFQTLFSSVDPNFDDGRVDQRLFRWIAGVDDPDIVKAFVSLGGEDGLSGTITVERLIAKCEAMQMTPQYIANFVALVDPNQDGVVDFTEFLSLLVRNRQELSGERKTKLTERGNGSVHAGFRFGSSTTMMARGGGDGSNEGESNLPFPRQKRFSRSDEGGSVPIPSARRVSLPFQGFDDEDLENESARQMFFQEKVRSIFDDPDVIQLDEDISADHSPRGGAYQAAVELNSPVTRKPPLDSDNDSDDEEEGGAFHVDSFGSGVAEHDSPRARAAKKRMSIQETHLGIGLAGILLAKAAGKQKAPLSMTERIDQTVKRGSAAIAMHREKVESAMIDMDKRRQRKYIRTDDGLVEGNRESGETALKQRQRLHNLRVERAARRAQVHAKPPPPRVAAMSLRAVEELKKEVSHLVAQLEGGGGSVAQGMVKDRSPQRPPIQTPLLTSAPTPPTPVLLVTTASNVDPTQNSQKMHPPSRPNPPPRRYTPPRGVYNVEQPHSIPMRPPSNSGRLSRPTSATTRPSPTPTPAVPGAAGQSQSESQRVPPEKAHRQVKLEDPLSLWKLLEANHRRMVSEDGVSGHEGGGDLFSAENAAHRTAQHGSAHQGDVAAKRDAHLSTRRAFARTIASHLTLRLPYDDQLDSASSGGGLVGPASIHQAYILNAPAPRALNTTGMVSPTKQRPYSGAATTTTATQRGDPSTISAKGSPRQPTRPQTAPSRRQPSQRPMSAKTSLREAQLNRATNCTPTPAAPNSSRPPSRPCSATTALGASGRPSSSADVMLSSVNSKQFGVGGLFDADDVGDDCDVVYV